jgi:hypothetical protein
MKLLQAIAIIDCLYWLGGSDFATVWPACRAYGNWFIPHSTGA